MQRRGYLIPTFSYIHGKDKNMAQISIAQTIFACVGILALIGYVAYYGAMNNI